jgi:endo-1,4-beta-D-glucanase Y
MKFFLLLLFAQFSLILSNAQTIQANSMTLGGPYAGTISSPFAGVAFYGNGDDATGSLTLTNATGVYSITATGASSNSSTAQIDLYVDGTKVGSFSFTGTSATTSTLPLTITSGTTTKAIKLLLSTDNGSNDTYVESVAFSYQGPVPPPRPAPVPSNIPTSVSGVYRNMFVESGQTTTDVSNKMNQLWNQYFVTGDSATQRLFYNAYNAGPDMAFILDVGDNDIRSEGQSYGMMICLQLNHQTEFNKLWKFAKTFSQHPQGTNNAGLFAWHLNSTYPYSPIDQNPAPDGEEYYVTSLLFAAKRWGNGTGIYNYQAQADSILGNMINKGLPSLEGCPTSLIDTVQQEVIFANCGSSAIFTDPSYHLPAFYQIWATDASSNNQLWANMAARSRTYLWPGASNPSSGLMADYSEFNGTPENQPPHNNFEYDAWRTIMNMAVDQTWFKQDSTTIVPLINNQLNFFKTKPGYPSLWSWDGTSSLTTDHSPGLIGCNAAGTLVSRDSSAWAFIDEAWNTPIPSGQYRYYDGLLYMMSFMHLSGNFKIYPVAAAPAESPYLGSPANIPGRIYADNYDLGGEGVAYHEDTSVNQGGYYRLTEAVGVGVSEDTADNGYVVGWTNPGQWMNYTVNVLIPGTYILQARVASPSSVNDSLHVEIDGVNVSGEIVVPTTGDWQNWQTVTVTTTSLTTGQHIMKIYEGTGGYNINYLNFILSICPGGSNIIISSQTGSSYQWQVSTDGGSSYSNISNGASYSGVTTDTLTILSASGSLNGDYYRCTVNGTNGTAYPIKITDTWTGAVNNFWETAGNWSCGTVPNSNTDVIINTGSPTISSNVSIRSLQLSSSANLTVNAGKQLNVLH